MYMNAHKNQKKDHLQTLQTILRRIGPFVFILARSSARTHTPLQKCTRFEHPVLGEFLKNLFLLECFRKKKKSRILPLFLPDFTISIMVKTGLFLNAFTSFAFALKKRYFTTIFLWTALFPAAASFPVWIKLPYSKLNAPPMGGWQHKEKDRGRIVVFFSSLTAVFSLSLFSFSRTTLSTTVQFSCFRPEVYRCL